jgi:hypothetical protein
LIKTQNLKDTMESIKIVEAALGAVKGSSPIKSALSKARLALRGKKTEPKRPHVN